MATVQYRVSQDKWAFEYSLQISAKTHPFTIIFFKRFVLKTSRRWSIFISLKTIHLPSKHASNERSKINKILGQHFFKFFLLLVSILWWGPLSILLAPSRLPLQIRPKCSSPMGWGRDYQVTNDLYLWTMENYPSATFALGDEYPGRRSTVVNSRFATFSAVFMAAVLRSHTIIRKM